MTLEQAIEILWNSIQRGVHDPDELAGKLSIDDAHQVLLGLLERHEKDGQRPAGWKVGLTAKAIQVQLGHHEPVFGFLLESGHLESGVDLRSDQLKRPALENELCVRLRAPLRGPGVTVEKARDAISHVAPAFEVIEKRWRGTTPDMPLTLADSAQQRAFVTGAFVPLGTIDLAKVAVEVRLNGEAKERAYGKEVMGSPVACVAWLANKLARYGRSLDAGTLIMTGSFTKQYDVTRGDTAELNFEGVGTVSVSFS